MGLLVIISSPSGGGKDSVIRALLNKIPNSARFLTTTTRPPRPGEQNGFDYNFISREEFEKLINNDELIEYNKYADNYYGTEKDRMQEMLNKFDVVFSNIEINGKKNFDKSGWANISIFLLPENLEVLKNRIIKRGGLTPEIIEKRLETAKKEMAESNIYDYSIVNTEGQLDKTVEEAENIIKNALNKSSIDK